MQVHNEKKRFTPKVYKYKEKRIILQQIQNKLISLENRHFAIVNLVINKYSE